MSEDALPDLLALVRKSHRPGPPATAADLDRLRALGMPADVLAFYAAADGALLHRGDRNSGIREVDGAGWLWGIVPAREVQSIQEMGYIPPDSPHYARSSQWLAVTDEGDGNWLAISVEPGHGGEILDCFHETVGDPGYTSIVALSFTEMLKKLLAGTSAFWLDQGSKKYGAY